MDIQVTRPEDLDAEAAITIADVLAAHAAWTQDAPEKYRHLLDATLKPAAGA
jgi:hypothetical protein